ncbi:MAG: hypothetical protein NZL83_04885 [Candidatus Absconditabacterales bacterium]|nr:hypothetical protein [Candidatus Absconditabacterales bacterium]
MVQKTIGGILIVMLLFVISLFFKQQPILLGGFVGQWNSEGLANCSKNMVFVWCDSIPFSLTSKWNASSFSYIRGGKYLQDSNGLYSLQGEKIWDKPFSLDTYFLTMNHVYDSTSGSIIFFDSNNNGHMVMTGLSGVYRVNPTLSSYIMPQGLSDPQIAYSPSQGLVVYSTIKSPFSIEENEKITHYQGGNRRHTSKDRYRKNEKIGPYVSGSVAFIQYQGGNDIMYTNSTIFVGPTSYPRNNMTEEEIIDFVKTLPSDR